MTDRTSGSRWRDVERFVGAVAALAVLVVAVPAVLVGVSLARFGSGSPVAGVPPPSAWSLAAVRDALTEPVGDAAVADLVIRTSLVVAWTAVLVIVLTTAAELFHRWRHRGIGLPTVRGVRWAQPLAGFIASGLIVFASLHTPRVALSSAMPGASAPVTIELERAGPNGDDIGSERRDEAPSSRPLTPTNAVHVVVRGDSVYGIASSLAGGDPARTAALADEILELNLGRRMTDGSVFTNPAYIDVGWRLVLPPRGAGDRADGLVYVVEVGDTLSHIAEQHLGDSSRWTDIWSANAGGEMIDGRRFDDPDLILPGWRLVLPDRDADDPTTPTEAASDVDVGPDIVAEPLAEPDVDVAPDIAAEPLAEPDGEPDVAAEPDVAGVDEVATRDEVPLDPVAEVSEPILEPTATTSGDSSATTVPATTTPSGTATSPTTSTPVPVSTTPSPSAPTGAATTTSTTAPAPVAGDGSAVDSAPSEAPPIAPSPIRIEHAALVAAGVLSIVAVRRRQRMRSALPRTRIPPPRPDGAEIERRLRRVDAGERLMRVDVAVRAAAATLIGTGERIGLVTASPDGTVDVCVTGDVHLPPPWTGSGSRWALPGATPIELLAEEACKVAMPCIALAQIGVGPDGEDVMVDLEACGTLVVDADDATADAVVAALATSVASSPFAEVAHLVTASVPDTAMIGHRGSIRTESAEGALELARELTGGVAAQDGTSFELRARRTGGEVWEPAVVFLTTADSAVPDDSVEPGRGVAVVRTGPASEVDDGRCSLSAGSDHWTFDGLGVSYPLTPVGVTQPDLEAVGDLLADASEPLAAPRFGEPDDEVQLPSPGSLDHEIVVGIVGEVIVTDRSGRSATFERGKTVELIVWLATHRERSTRTAARTALWELDVRDATFANVVSEARRGLARLVAPPEVQEWVARTLTESLPLHELVVTDADLIEHRLTAARLEPPAQAIGTLRPAVELVRGMPFSGTSYLWPDAEGITSSLVLLAMTACSELAAHALSVGDVETVFWATGRGLAVLPGHEELVGLRMRAHARAGDLAGVRQEWESYERVIVADTWSDGEPAPKLLDLRRHLLS